MRATESTVRTPGGSNEYGGVVVFAVSILHHLVRRGDLRVHADQASYTCRGANRCLDGAQLALRRPRVDLHSRLRAGNARAEADANSDFMSFATPRRPR